MSVGIAILAAGRGSRGNPDLLATIARVAVWAFAIVIAVNQIGIATTIVNTLFMATVGAVAVASALAFGLGGRETAAQIVQGWYQRGQQAAPKLGEAVDAASRQAQSDPSIGAPSAVSRIGQPSRP